MLGFIEGAMLVMHNAAFDFAFLNAELERLTRPLLRWDRVVDTLALARRKHPGSPCSLDALCKRYGVDLSEREKHSALLDCRLLAAVYVELVGGHQARLELMAQRRAARRCMRRSGQGARVRPIAACPRASPRTSGWRMRPSWQVLAMRRCGCRCSPRSPTRACVETRA